MKLTLKFALILINEWIHQVNEVRTSDDTMLTVKVMLFYEIVDILKMVCIFFFLLFTFTHIFTCFI